MEAFVGIKGNDGTIILQFYQMKQILLSVFLVALASSCLFETERYVLTFEYAAREGRCLDDSRGNVFWNGAVVYSIVPCDYEIKTVSIEVRARGAVNVLQFEGAGPSNSYGLTIDNVKLVKKGTCQDLVVNGGFERPCQNGGWNTYYKVEGWEGNPLEIGNGKLYNCRWNSQVAELDSNNNYRLTQYFY